MRRAPAWLAALATFIAWLAAPAAAHGANLWITLAAGLPGSSTPSSTSEFTSPLGSNVAVTSLTGGISAEATTAGGNSFFGGVGLPVLLNLDNGSAYITNGSAPAEARSFGAGGGMPSSAAPVAGGSPPSDAALLGIDLAEPTSPGGSRSLTASLTDSSGNALGSGTVEVPDGGWWVIGLGPDTRTIPDTDPEPGPIDPPPPVDPLPETPGPVPTPGPTTGGPIATPEPATLGLVAIGGGTVCMWRRVRQRNAA